MTISSLLLERLGALMHQSLREDAARHGLLPIHVQVLQYLEQANRYSDLPIAIAEYFGITRGTVSQTLAVLERKDLLSRKADSQHGRRVHLQLTRSGRRVLQDSWTDRIRAALDAGDDAVQLEESLRRVLASLQYINEQRAFGICHQCAHFQSGPQGTHCGLTGEALAAEQTVKICREWTAAA